MKQLLALIKLEFALKFPRFDKSKKLYVKIFDVIAILIGVGIVAALIMFMFKNIINICLRSNLGNEFLIFFILIVQLIQLFIGLGLLTKTLFFNSDSGSLLKLPVSGEKIFVAKSLFAFIYMCMFSFLIMVPVLIMYGILAAGYGMLPTPALYYCMIPFVCVFSAILPFILATIFALPTMYIISFLKSKFVLMLITYVAIVAIGFVTYMQVLDILLKLLNSNDAGSVLTADVVANVKNITYYFYPEVALKNILTGNNFLKSFLVTILVGSVCVIGLVYIAKKIYVKVLLNNVESENTFLRKNIKIKKMSVTSALFKREFINIFRSVNYSFQYLAVVLTTPLMVYFSNAICGNIGIEKLGSGLLPGISILVLIMFLSMAVSFSASSLTREGDKFFHTKIIPVTYKRQVSVKLSLYMIVTVPSILISCVALWLFGTLSISQALLYTLAISLIMLGNACFGIERDLKNPKFKYLGNEEMTNANRNIISSVGIGLVISLVLGVAAIIVSYIFSLNFIYYILFGFAVPYAVIEFITLYAKIEKKYHNIEA